MGGLTVLARNNLIDQYNCNIGNIGIVYFVQTNSERKLPEGFKNINIGFGYSNIQWL